MSKAALLRSSIAPQPPRQPPDDLVPDPTVAREFSITLMTLWRWTHDVAMNFPPPVKINGRNYRSRRQLEQFKERMMRAAIEQRDRKTVEA